MRALLTALALAGCLAVSGCGESESESTRELSEGLGGRTEQDAEALSDFVQAAAGLANVDIDVTSALTDGKLEKAQRGVDRLERMGRETKEAAAAAETGELRAFLGDYSDGIADLASTYQRALDTPASADPAVVDRLTRRIVSIKERTNRLDTRFADEMKKTLSPEEVERMEAEQRKLQERLDEAASGGG
jgi:polyhydroxyalkanoate synthesis regulator phasin